MIRAVIFDLDNCLSAPSSDTGQLAAPPIVHEALAEPGQPLYAGTRAFMEPRFGHDFSRVRVHSDAKAAESAEAVNARAYTVGSHVVLGEGQPSPESIAGRHLLAHELAHVVQQSRRGTAPVLTASAPHEQEAHAAAIAVAIGLPSVRITCNTGVGVARSNGLHSTEDPIHPTENPTLLAELQEELMAQKQALANAPVIRDILAESGIELTVPLEGNLPPSVIRRALERVVKRGGPYAKEAEPILGELEEIRGHLEILSRRRGLIRMSGAKAEGTAAKVESTRH
jgi:hypothetical protein